MLVRRGRPIGSLGTTKSNACSGRVTSAATRRCYSANWRRIMPMAFLQTSSAVKNSTRTASRHVYPLRHRSDGERVVLSAFQVSYRWLRYVDRQVHPYQYCTPPNTKRAEYAPGSPCRYLEGTGFGMAWTGDVQQRLDKLHRSGRLTTPRGGRVPLFLTEFGYVAYGGNEIPENVRAAWYLLAVDVRDATGTTGVMSPPVTRCPSRTAPSGCPWPWRRRSASAPRRWLCTNSGAAARNRTGIRAFWTRRAIRCRVSTRCSAGRNAMATTPNLLYDR
jgi:hypothetical protein